MTTDKANTGDILDLDAAALCHIADNFEYRRQEAELARAREQVRGVLAECKKAAENGKKEATYSVSMLTPMALELLQRKDIRVEDKTKKPEEGEQPFYTYHLQFGPQG